MMVKSSANCLCIFLCLLFFWMGAPTQAQEPDVELFLISSGFSNPVYVTHAGDGSGRLFVVEQRGRIRIIDPLDGLLPADFLHLGPENEGGLNLVSTTGSERGLLGLAFHPNYEINGLFYVCYTTREDLGAGVGSTIVAEFTVSDNDPNRADFASQRIILGPIRQPGAFRNGGMIEFGPDDGYLYIGLGDGGGEEDEPVVDDQIGNAQDTSNLLGSILRINVNFPTSSTILYSIPPTNPFVSGPLIGMGSPEIYAWGLRDPWRFSFDRVFPYRLFCGDVGEGAREEIDIIENGENYGWKVLEGSICTPPTAVCDMSAGYTFPIFEYQHVQANEAVVGGYVYRGFDYPAMQGLYFFGDYRSGRIWSIEEDDDGNWGPRTEHLNIDFISSFGEDERGEIYVVEYEAGNQGTVYRLIDGNIGTPTPLPTRTATRTNTPVAGAATATPSPSPTQPGAPTATPTNPGPTSTPMPTSTGTLVPIPTFTTTPATPGPTATRTPVNPPSKTQSPTPTSSPQPYDLEPDGSVDAIDLLEFLRQEGGQPPSPGAQDADQGAPTGIDPNDLFVLALHWQESTAK
jgi:glucose/arabinose dehydrogenase